MSFVVQKVSPFHFLEQSTKDGEESQLCTGSLGQKGRKKRKENNKTTIWTEKTLYQVEEIFVQ